MSLLLLSFFAGILTVFAPCVFTLLPVIIGGSLTNKNKLRPFIITVSLAISIIIFTLLLKVSTLFVNLDPNFLKYLSGGIIVIFGLISLFPGIWDKVSIGLGLSKNSDSLLEAANQKEGISGAILLGMALGPVFSSCSPTYALIVATILPVDIFTGMLNIVVYAIGLSLIMLLIAFYGRSFVKKFKWAANPSGWFKRGLGVIFIIVGLSIITGFDKQAQVFLADKTNFNTSQFEQALISKTIGNQVLDTKNILNVTTIAQAPEFSGIQGWINSTGETKQSLKGKVVLVDFWTYSCINCIRTTPYLTKWYETYKQQGFEIVGIHAPEFSFEKKIENVQKAITERGITYPVGLDNDFKTWNAFGNTAWPGEYLIDKDGNIRRIHLGEGEYDKTEEAIRILLKDNGKNIDNIKMVEGSVNKSNNISSNQTDETYLGYSRQDKFANRPQMISEQGYNKVVYYNEKANIDANNWSLSGYWTVENENIISQSDDSKLKIKFNAKQVYLVMGKGDIVAPDTTQNAISNTTSNVTVKINTKYPGQDVNSKSEIELKDYRLYRLVNAPEFQNDGELELIVPKGVKLNVFTFGS
jgi:cytochrome c biogenesis protein CcdA/thiol-disulfide isomerase/thioredoxin